MIVPSRKHFVLFCDCCERQIFRGKTVEECREAASKVVGGHVDDRHFLCPGCAVDPDESRRITRIRTRLTEEFLDASVIQRTVDNAS